MPTPVSSATQCLTEEAARVLDEAVVVARRRSHSQTTSLHAVSALLSPAMSSLREACARARSSGCSPRLQLRALELCVGVSLDRLPSSVNKSLDDAPPVSNSLMAAIKRSQANQRRHPETFHLYQMHQQLYDSQSSLSCVKVELKHFILSILDDPTVDRVFGDAGFRSSEVKLAIIRRPTNSRIQKSMGFPPLFLCDSRLNFPFSADSGEENFKRIGNVLAKKSSKNPLLIGTSANNVLSSFMDSLKIGKDGFLPSEIKVLKLNVMCIDKEICDFVAGNLCEEMMGSKLTEVRDKVKSCTGGGVILNFGELKVFVNGGSTGAVDYIVSQLSCLMEICCGKVWLIGAVGSYENYMKFLRKFPAIEIGWDLNLLPITSFKWNTNGSHLNSSLMGSFVPFGGFFSGSTELESSSSSTNKSVTRCDLCNDKYEDEISNFRKGGRTESVADQQSESLASWLQSPVSHISNIIEAKDDGGALNARVEGLQRKWNDICHRLHHCQTSQQNSSQIRPKIPFIQHRLPIDFFTPMKHTSTSSSSITSVTTDLGLGMICVSPDLGPRSQDHKVSVSVEVDGINKNASNHNKASEKDFKQLYRALSDKIRDQDDAICAISQTISRCRTGNGRRRCSSHRVDIWLMFIGPDRIGKKIIATALAEVIFGNKESLISIDLNFENGICNQSSIFGCKGVNFCDSRFRGKTIIDYIAEELTKKPRSIVLLEHIDKADLMTQDSLSRAIRTGKLPDTHGREISINNAIFVTTSSSSKETEEILDLHGYSEERILNAKALKMRISVESVSKINSSNVLFLPKQSFSTNPTHCNKRKFIETSGYEIILPQFKKPKSKSCFDLNLPVDETECTDHNSNCVEDSTSETNNVWIEEFLKQVDEKVIFKPLNFDSIAEHILKNFGLCFQKAFGPNVLLEIEDGIVLQILASYWLSDRKNGVEEWIDTVLFNGFMEAKQNLCVNPQSMVKLVAVEGLMEEEHAPVCLPQRII